MKEVMYQQPSSLRWFFFMVGIIATLAYRIIIILNFYDPLWVKISWYIGTIGFILYFGYLFNLQSKRADLATQYNLLNVVRKMKGIKEKQKEALRYIVKSNATSKAKWNSAIIFILSVLALIIGIILDFFIL
tara:strand:+ start:495 stop:890 length:396 start_codon:yes stop_codon:yes gene_type:complete